MHRKLAESPLVYVLFDGFELRQGWSFAYTLGKPRESHKVDIRAK